MAVLSLLPSVYTNDDSLRIFLPGSAHVLTRGGERSTDTRHETFVVVDLTTLPTYSSGDVVMVAENLSIPKGSIIEDIEINVTKETAGSSADLDLGLVRFDRVTEYDFNGLLDGAASFNAGTDLGKTFKFQAGGTGSGVLLGIPTLYPGILVARPKTADFSGGIVEIRVHWFVPLAADV